MFRTLGAVLVTGIALVTLAGTASAADDTAQTCATAACVGNVVHADNLVNLTLVHVDTVHVFG